MCKVIMLDAGHGGADPGATCGQRKESQLVLQLVLYEAKIWERMGFKAVLTRSNDSTVSISARTKLENATKPACFIAHHMDWGPGSASGASVWLHSKAPAKYMAWGQEVLKEIAAVGLTTNRAVDIHRGHRDGTQYDYGVNRDTNSPSMLLELGFITNAANTAEFDKRYKDYARAIVIGTCCFLGVSTAVPTVQEVDGGTESTDNTSQLAAMIAEHERMWHGAS